MRTIRVAMEVPVPSEGNSGLFGSAVPTLSISTEVIVGEDIDARAAGLDARRTIDRFIAGYVEEVEA